MLIKENCWKWPAGEGYHFVKLYRHTHIKQKVQWIHDQLTAIHFPHILPIVKHDAYAIHQPWVHARSANFERAIERDAAIECLMALHETNKQINWQQNTLLPSFQLVKKWKARYNKFMEFEPILKAKLGNAFFNETANYAKSALKHIGTGNVPEQLTILHGDVVHHNFLYCRDQSIKLIDFDLATLGDAREELVLWCHRVLPHIHYDVDALFEEHTQLQKLNDMRHYLAYPNELMREALYYVQLQSHSQSDYQQFFEPFAEKALANWHQVQAKVYA